MRDVAGGHWPAVTEDLGEGQGRSDVGQPADSEPDSTERITLIEFTWMGVRGAQPVILVAREWLQ